MHLPGTVKMVASSNSNGYALLTNGSLYAWGVGRQGQLGTGRRERSLWTPVKVHFPAGVRIAWIPTDVMPEDTGLAVDTTGQLWGWGTTNFGNSMCLRVNRPLLTPIRLQFRDVTLAAGAWGNAQYMSHGRVYACGDNQNGALGDGTTVSTPFVGGHTPTMPHLPAGAKVETLNAGWQNHAALMTNGTVYEWGYNAQGQVGQGVIGGIALLPLKVDLPGPVKILAVGGSFPRNGQTLALLANGSLYAWGDGRQYQLGTGNTASQPSPVRILKGMQFTKIATAGATSYGITRTGDVYAWGDNSAGQIGNGTKTTAKTPVLVAHHATQISATNNFVVIKLG
jgi:alpha-tubulin suppressor-like RCC1 family protein